MQGRCVRVGALSREEAADTVDISDSQPRGRWRARPTSLFRDMGLCRWRTEGSEVGIKRVGRRFIPGALYPKKSLLFENKAILIPKKSDFFLTLSRPNLKKNRFFFKLEVASI